MICLRCGIEVDPVRVQNLEHPLCEECNLILHSSNPLWRLWREVEALKKRMEELETRYLPGTSHQASTTGRRRPCKGRRDGR